MDEGFRQDLTVVSAENTAGGTVSVIIPAHNAATFLTETLDAVLACTLPGLEVVVVDDGSTDGTAALAQQRAAGDARLRVIVQSNRGVCCARNRAIAEARGTFILPVDADDLIEPWFITEAAALLAARPDVRVVTPRAVFFGARQGAWRLPSFSLRELARHNIMSITAMFRRADWVRVGGYCTEIIAREDWEFWIALLKDLPDADAAVVRLDEKIGLHYRVHRRSKRTADRKLKAHVVRTLNRRHPEFFERMLGGPLHLHRSWSRVLNAFYRFTHPRRAVVSADFTALTEFVRVLPQRFAWDTGEVIFKNRNEIRAFHIDGHDIVVKEFRRPHLLNRVAYGLFRASKAERSYRYAAMLRAAGIGSPAPVGWLTERNGLLFTRSYYASLQSECPISYMALLDPDFPDRDALLAEVARTAAAMHEHGWLHTDFSRGNILLGHHADGTPRADLIDLNRIRFRTVDIEAGCRNFARLPATPPMLRILADTYATARGFDPETCLRLIRQHHTGER